MRNKAVQEESEHLECKVLDWGRFTNDVVSHFITELGDEAREWSFQIDGYGHPQVFPPTASSFGDAKARWDAIEYNMSAALSLPDKALFPSPFSVDGPEAQNDGPNLPDPSSLGGPLPSLLNCTGAVCACYVPGWMIRGFVRNGSYLRSGSVRNPSLDMALYIYDSPREERGTSGKFQGQDDLSA